jgi:hypothetical protein
MPEPNPTQHVQQDVEVGRISSDLASQFRQVDRDTIEAVVRVEFQRRSTAPIQDFVPIFVERALRQRLQRVHV